MPAAIPYLTLATLPLLPSLPTICSFCVSAACCPALLLPLPPPALPLHACVPPCRSRSSLPVLFYPGHLVPSAAPAVPCYLLHSTTLLPPACLPVVAAAVRALTPIYHSCLPHCTLPHTHRMTYPYCPLPRIPPAFNTYLYPHTPLVQTPHAHTPAYHTTPSHTPPPPRTTAHTPCRTLHAHALHTFTAHLGSCAVVPLYAIGRCSMPRLAYRATDAISTDAAAATAVCRRHAISNSSINANGLLAR